MQSVIEAPSVEPVGHAPRRPEQALEFRRQFWRRVAKGSALFQPGDPRRLYRVESGAICHYVPTARSEDQIIEFAFPGDIIGLGYLATHLTTAKAMVETLVSAITDADLEHALANDNRLFFRLAEAGEREFDHLKSRSLDASPRPPIQRVANFLLALVNMNASEGRALLIVTDDISSGYVAEQLQMSISALAQALLKLRENGVVDVVDRCLSVLDISALETMAADA